jgi:hypothetical protein
LEIAPLAERAWHLSEAMSLFSIQTRLCWLSGDLAWVQDDFSNAEDSYTAALSYAKQVSPALVATTEERIQHRGLSGVKLHA